MLLHLQIIFSTNKVDDSKVDGKILHISYPGFPSMCMKGDTIFLGKYLVTGSEDSSLYLEVLAIHPDL